MPNNNSSQQPLATPAFDPYICASLHNKIVSFLTTQAPAHNNRIVHNFFNAYEEANAIRDRLPEPLITLLENIDIVVSTDPESSPVINFAPHLCMPNPNEVWALNGGLPGLAGEDDHENWVVLYLATEQELGIYIDLDTCLCTWQREVMPWMRTW